MIKIIKSLLPVLFLGLMVFFYGLTLMQNHDSENRRAVQLLYTEQPLTVREGLVLLEREKERESEQPLTVALWGKMPQQTIRFAEFAREMKVDVVVICGDSSLLFPSRYPLQMGEENKVLLSSDVAFRLFGTSRIVDGANFYRVHLGGREYTIRGVLAELENTVVIQGYRGMDRILNGAAVEVRKGQSPRSTIREFELRFWPAERVFDGMMISMWGRLFTWLLPVIVGITLLIGAIKHGKSLLEKPVKCAAWIGGVVLFFMLFIWLHRDLPVINLNISLTMWSDFNYWRDFFGDKAGAFRRIFQEEWRAPERLIIMNTWRLMQYGFLSTGIFVLFVRKIKIESWWWLLLYCGCSIIVVFWVVINNQIGDITGVNSLWWLASLFLIGKNANCFLLRKHIS